MMALVSRELSAYFSLQIRSASEAQLVRRIFDLARIYRLRMKTIRGMQSRSLWGPGDGLGA